MPYAFDISVGEAFQNQMFENIKSVRFSSENQYYYYFLYDSIFL